jgi:hypothetical protein
LFCRNQKTQVRLFYVFRTHGGQMLQLLARIRHAPGLRGLILAVFRHLVEAVALLDQGGHHLAHQIGGTQMAMVPTIKKVALMFISFNVSSTSLVRALGPSSKVRAMVWALRRPKWKMLRSWKQAELGVLGFAAISRQRTGCRQSQQYA